MIESLRLSYNGTVPGDDYTGGEVEPDELDEVIEAYPDIPEISASLDAIFAPEQDPDILRQPHQMEAIQTFVESHRVRFVQASPLAVTHCASCDLSTCFVQ